MCIKQFKQGNVVEIVIHQHESQYSDKLVLQLQCWPILTTNLIYKIIYYLHQEPCYNSKNFSSKWWLHLVLFVWIWLYLQYLLKKNQYWYSKNEPISNTVIWLLPRVSAVTRPSGVLKWDSEYGLNCVDVIIKDLLMLMIWCYTNIVWNLWQHMDQVRKSRRNVSGEDKENG